jgi:phosphoribosyl 1,2-cyclic phosphodiesterase
MPAETELRRGDGNRAQQVLRVKFWGSRGSIATPGPNTLRYGGNTACVEVRYGDSVVVFDCGTGIRELGNSLQREFNGAPIHVHLFVSHTHWDHIQGFPFFMPAYAPSNTITIYGLSGPHRTLEKAFRNQMDSIFFPLPMDHLKSRIEFVEFTRAIEIDGGIVRAKFVNHPGLASAFRIDIDGKSVVYMTDHEPYYSLFGNTAENLERERELTEFARGANIYIREAQYTAEEYAAHRGWGHGTFGDALLAARDAGVATLVIYHHDPRHDDDCLDRIYAECCAEAAAMNLSSRILFAAENLELSA